VWIRVSPTQQQSAARLHFTRSGYHAMDILRPAVNPHELGTNPDKWIGYFLDDATRIGMVELTRPKDEE
jgi:hypothetical protein